MSKIHTRIGFLLVVLCSSLSWGQNLLHYWNFNNNASVAVITTPTTSNIPGASITAAINGISTIDFAGGTGQNFNVLNLNAQNGDASGAHLRFNDPIGSALVFALPTTGYENIIVKFATRRSAQGAGSQLWSYSINGASYPSFTTILPNNGDPGLATLDFSAISGADNNPNFKLKVEFIRGAGGTEGNNRFDNFTVHGTTFTGGADTTAPIATFLPVNGATNVAAGVHPTIAFNENIRLVNDTAITNSNVDALVEVRLNNASGALVPFDAAFASNTITIIPASALANNQQYYIALLPNTIEDESDNAITGMRSAIFTTANPSTSSIDLSTYVRVGRYDLPEPTRSAHPANSLLAQEVSAVTYNWDTNTLFVVGDGSTSIVQITKQGQLINSMTLAQGNSPQGTEFYDTEGLAYIGNGQFVMSEERDRQVVLFTYAPGTTLTRNNTKTVKLGTFVNNTGTEGLSFDPITNGYIVLKEIDPMGIFQTSIDFNAGTATNGSATTENSVNLFDPALMNVLDVADVFALSNLPVPEGQPLSGNLLVLSQESAKVVNIDRNGNIANTLTIVSDPENPLNAASQQHEGLTMDNDGILYIVNENGGGDIDHPQLWVYAPSTMPNQAPTAVALTNTINTILENTSTATPVKVADIVVTDDGLGTNNLTLSGTDANFFQITGSALYIKAGTVLDYEVKTTYNVTINVDDATIGTTPDVSVDFILTVIDVIMETPQASPVSISEVAPWSSGDSPVGADWFEVTNNGTTALNITGWKVDDNSNSFAAAIALTGITSIAPGESVIFLETSSGNPAATVIASFKSVWFGANPPAGLQIGTYQGSGIGLSTGGDALNLYDAGGNLQANVVFGNSPTTLFRTFNNSAGLNNTTISLLSQIGVNDAFAAVNDPNEIGSPGSVGRLFISEVAPWSSGNSPVEADWFEVTNTKAVAVDITGWKVDDNSQSPVAAVPLSGITSINPGESVIFIETNDLTGKTADFLNNWFGTNPSSGVRIGNYNGGGIGLGTGGDQVNLYNSSNVLQTSVLFGTSPTTTYATFDNSAGRNSLIVPITQLSVVGVNGAFIAANSPAEIGSPGTIVTAPCPAITVTATPVSSSVCLGTTTTVSVTATGGTLPYTVTGSPLTVGGGTHNYIITDARGCTATASVNITEQPATDHITTVSACGSYTWDVNGQTYTASGLYIGTTTNCVTEKLDLTINDGTTNSNLTITAAGSYTWAANGQTYTASGVYTHTSTNAAGCPDVATLNLTISVNTFNLGTSCGATVSSLAVTVIAGVVSGASSYTFRITNMNTSASFVVTRPVNSFALSNYAGITLGTPYQVEVSVNGGLNYGTPCIINTPSPTSTIGAQCGTTLTAMGEFVYATYFASVNAYRFRITNTATNAIQVYDALSGQNRFTFSQLPAAFVSFGTTYSVEVALRNTDGSYLPYNPGCNITTPAFPTSEVILSQCDMAATGNTQNISAVVVPGATSYRFQLTNAASSYGFSIDRAVNTFNLSMFPGLLPGTTYTVRVAVKIGGAWGPLTGKPCSLTTPGIAPGGTRTVAASNNFEVIAFPNPFAESLMFDVKTSTESAITIRVYDMLGKQVENRSIDAADSNSIQFGDVYPSGVYNVVISQGENTKTLRVIKR